MKRMRKGCLLSIVCCLLLLASCSTSQPESQGFIWSGNTGVAFLTWTNASDQLSGTYTLVTSQGMQTSDAFTGQQQDASHVTLQFPTGLTMNGTINGATLQTSDITGTMTWYAGTSQQYSQLQTAYQASLQEQSDLEALQAIEARPQNNSDPAYYQTALQQAQNRVTAEQNELTFIQQQSDPLTRCSALQEFSLDFPPASQDSELQLPFSQAGDQGPQAVVDRSDLARAITTLSNDAHQEASLPLPTIQGLPFPWKVKPQATLDQGHQQEATLKSAVFAVAPQFPPLRAQAEQIQAQEATINQAHQCFG
jgi:hypothetical protein